MPVGAAEAIKARAAASRAIGKVMGPHDPLLNISNRSPKSGYGLETRHLTLNSGRGP